MHTVKPALPFAIGCLALALCANAQIYKWTDATGKIHYSDKPPPEAKAAQVPVDPVTSYQGPPQVDSWAAIIRKPVKTDPPAAGTKPLTMYATSWCGYCRKARAYLAAKGVAYREVDIEASEANRAEYKQHGGKGVPLFIAGERRMRGFSEPGMEQFLKTLAR